MTKQQQVFLDIHGINRQTLSLLCKYGLLTKRQVKMAGYWPSSFFCVFMDRGGSESRSITSFDKNGSVQ